MTRRLFIEKILSWGKMLAVSNLLPSGVGLNVANSSGNDPVYLPPIGLRRELETAGLLDSYLSLNHGETFFYRS